MAAVTPSLLLGAQDEPRANGDKNRAFGDWQRHRFSHAVAEGVFASVSAAMAAGVSDGGRMKVAAHAWNTARDHFGEVGFTSATDQLLTKGYDVREIMAAAAKMPSEVADLASKHGANVPVELLQSRAALTPERTEAALAYIREVGTAGVFRRIAEVMNETADRREPGAPKRIIENIDNACQALAMLTDALWVLAGLWTLGCAVTGGACVPCCVGAAVIGILAGITGMIYDYYCY